MDPALLDQYKTLDWNSLLMHRLGEAGALDRAKPALDRLKKFLDSLLEPTVLKSIPPEQQQDIANHVRNFLNLSTSIRNYSDVSQRDYHVDRINREVGELLLALHKYDFYVDELAEVIKTEPLESVKILTQQIDSQRKELEQRSASFSAKITSAEELASRILNDREKIGEALSTVDRFTKENEAFVQSLLQRHASSFSQKAQEHVTLIYERRPIPLLDRISWLGINRLRQPAWFIKTIAWLYASLFMAIIILGMITYFILHEQQLTPAAAILHVSALAIPTYFLVLFVNQFLLHRRLYEIYKFKDIALQTMIMLRSQFDSDDKRELLRRSMAVIFTEPGLARTEAKYDRQIISELIRMIGDKGSV